MRKISFRVRNFDKEQFLTFNIDRDAKLDEELLNFLEDEEPRGIVPVIYEEEEEYDAFSYNITDKIHLSELSNQEINAEMVLMVMRSLVMTLIDMAEYRIPLAYLVLNRNYIYVDSDYRIEFICVPLEDMQEDVNLNSFLRNFLASLRFDLSERGDYVARLFTYINNPALFNLRNMVNLIDELMSDMNVTVPEDASAEIYVEYAELDEKEAEDVVKEPVADDAEDASAEQPEPKETLFGDSSWATVVDDEEEAPLTFKASVSEEESAGKLHAAEQKEEEPAMKFKGTEEEEPPMKLKSAEAEEPSMKRKAAEEEESPLKLKIAEPESTGEEPEIAGTSPESDEGELPDEDLETEDRGNSKQKAKNKPTDKSDKKQKDKSADKKLAFRGKDAPAAAVMLQDELDEFLAEKESEEHIEPHEDSNLRIKKNVKINRANILKNTQEELKEEEQQAGEERKETASGEKEENTDDSSKNASQDKKIKVNPYLVRVNTQDMMMITKSNFKIGTAGLGVDFTIQGNKAVSRVHAIIIRKDDEYFIKDNKSTNHTYVNGEQVTEGELKPLKPDSKIMLGDEEFIFKV
ncbi:MAG: FHA domain-containing protein [Lachnospiraceae bacterium]|nr:FHA domain-containing protein [Lachnospiraceae bacterium]